MQRYLARLLGYGLVIAHFSMGAANATEYYVQGYAVVIKSNVVREERFVYLWDGVIAAPNITQATQMGEENIKNHVRTSATSGSQWRFTKIKVTLAEINDPKKPRPPIEKDYAYDATARNYQNGTTQSFSGTVTAPDEEEARFRAIEAIKAQNSVGPTLYDLKIVNLTRVKRP